MKEINAHAYPAYGHDFYYVETNATEVHGPNFPGPGLPILKVSGSTPESAGENLAESLRQVGFRGKLYVDNGEPNGPRKYRIHATEVVVS